MISQAVFINKWLFRLSIVAVLGVIVGFFVPYVQMYFYKSTPIVVQNSNYAAFVGDPLPEINRNIFDPTGQIWQSTMSKKPKSKPGPGGQNAGDIDGIVDIPGMRGVLVGGKFVPIGGAVSGGNLEAIENGKIKINTSQGITEIDINHIRNQQRQSLNIQIR